MSLYAKTGVFHKISGKKPCYRLDDPGMRLDIAIGGPQFDYLHTLFNIHGKPAALHGMAVAL
jgi:uncharacterized Zn-binding protein involved in type VI secretion